MGNMVVLVFLSMILRRLRPSNRRLSFSLPILVRFLDCSIFLYSFGKLSFRRNR